MHRFGVPFSIFKLPINHLLCPHSEMLLGGLHISKAFRNNTLCKIRRGGGGGGQTESIMGD